MTEPEIVTATCENCAWRIRGESVAVTDRTRGHINATGHKVDIR